MQTLRTIPCRRIDFSIPGRIRPGRFFLWMAAAAGAAGLAALPLRPGIVVGRSMEPTFYSGQPFLYRPLAGGETVHRGDVVLLRLQGEPAIKRVFALGGDRFWSVERGADTLMKSCLIRPGRWVATWKTRFPHFKYYCHRVPRGQVFVLGDGPLSVDSRRLGPVPAADVLGRVVYPPNPPEGTEGADQHPCGSWSEPPPGPEAGLRHLRSRLRQGLRPAIQLAGARTQSGP